MSGYLTGVLVTLAFNIIAAYAVYLPLAAGQLNLGIAGFMAIGAYGAAFLTNEMNWPIWATANWCKRVLMPCCHAWPAMARSGRAASCGPKR